MEPSSISFHNLVLGLSEHACMQQIDLNQTGAPDRPAAQTSIVG